LAAYDFKDCDKMIAAWSVEEFHELRSSPKNLELFVGRIAGTVHIRMTADRLEEA